MHYLIHRDLRAFTHVTEGQPGSNRSGKVHQCVCDERNNTQVVCVFEYVCVSDKVTKAIKTSVHIAGGYKVPRGG